jgi:hypothetical protein
VQALLVSAVDHAVLDSRRVHGLERCKQRLSRFWVNKPAGQNGKLEFCNWILKPFANEFFTLEAALDFNFSFLFF